MTTSLSSPTKGTNHILIVDDNPKIHEDFRRIFCSKDPSENFDADDAAYFGTEHHPTTPLRFELKFASQGQEALAMVRQSMHTDHRFSVAFMDIRMPPGWDGIETTKHLWQEDPDLHIIICTAYTDYSWDDMIGQLGQTDKLLILRKPFDVIEAEQAALAFSKKWRLLQDSRRHMMLLEQTMDLSPLLIFWANDDGSLQYANQSACSSLNREASELMPMKLWNIFPEWEINSLTKLWEKLQCHKSIKLETTISTNQKHPIPVEAIINILEFQNSSVLCITAQDISERIQTLRDLARARDAALESSRMKSQFLANMSHEIRTPMNGVLGMAELLGNTKLSTPQQEYVGIINQSGTALLSLINDILDSAKIDSGKIDLQRIGFNLAEIVKSSIQSVSANADKKDIRLCSHIDEEIPKTLWGDPGRLRQVLLNLVGNAVKFTKKGEVSVNAELTAETPTHCRLKFTVRDTGIGIPPQLHETIFQPFTQIDSTNTRAYGGTGLGLTISSQIVDAMGGKIHVTSSVGDGAEFSFTLDFSREAANSPDTTPGEPPQSATTSAHATSPQFATTSPSPPALNILVAEDNEVNRKVTLMQLKQLGYQADAVEDGKQAIDALHRKSYDVILMDCQMPVMDGFEATREIRRRFHTPLRIIAVTANAMKEDRNHCIKAGMDDYLSKPLSSEKLAQALGIPTYAAASHVAPAASAAQPHATEKHQAIDLDRLGEVTGDDRELLRDISSQYLKQAEDILDDMEHAIHSGLHEELSKLAHKLAGSSATCGMLAVVTPLRKLESLKPNQITDAIQLLKEARQQLMRIRQELAASLA